MFSGPLIGLFMALGVSTWVYTKTLRRTGGNNQSSLLVAGLTGVVVFVVVLTVVALIDSALQN